MTSSNPFSILKTTSDTIEDFQTREHVFSPEECARIIDLHKTSKQNLVSQLYTSHDNKKIRDSNVYWLFCDEETEWIFKKVCDAILAVNQSTFKFDLDGNPVAFQLTRYKVGQYYDWHMDMGNNVMSRRKISCSIQLSDKENYSGGELQIFRAENNIVTASKEIGSAFFFPCWVTHRATEVTQGERWALIGWVEGAPFR